MKNLLLLLTLLLATTATAQIDVSNVVTRDGTKQYRDTTFWHFTTCCSDPKLYQADLVQIRGNVRTVTLSSGLLTRQQFADWLQAERDRVASEIATLETATQQIKERHRALQLKIQER